MELVTHKKLKGGRLMPWGRGTVVIGAEGIVYLSGNTATAEDYDPTSKALAHPDLVIEIVAVAALPD